MIKKSHLNKYKLLIFLNINFLISLMFYSNCQTERVKGLLSMDWRFNQTKEIVTLEAKDTLKFVSCLSCYELKDSLVLNHNIRFYRILKGDSNGYKAFKFGNVFKISYHKNIYDIGVGDVIDVQGHWHYKKRKNTLTLKRIKIYEPKLDFLFNKKRKIVFKIIEINEKHMKLLVL